MKSPEVYRLLRDEVGPWAKEHGFRRTKTMLSWCRPYGKEHTVFWFQVSQDGWDDYAGSRFTVEFQRSEQPFVGEVSSFRQRIGAFLDDSSREEVRTIQNQIISSLTRPPQDHFLLQDDRTRDWYLGKFQLEKRPYSRRDDIWFRYHKPAHLHAWGQFILKHLPRCIQGVEDPSIASRPKPPRNEGRPWWRFW